eukprot:1687662-Rhodomonas_salina.1
MKLYRNEIAGQRGKTVLSYLVWECKTLLSPAAFAAVNVFLKRCALALVGAIPGCLFAEY